MIEQIKSELLYVLKTVPEIVHDAAKLSDLSNYTIKSASIYQDSDSISIAIIIYAVSKMMARHEEHAIENWHEIYPKIFKEIDEARTDLEADNIQGYRNHVKHIMEVISTFDKDVKLYIQEVIEKAKIKKGTNIYERGISVERAANIMGISVWDMMNYIGKTQIVDKQPFKTDAKKRIEFAKTLFDIK
jgi:hypothetical protein